MAATREQLPLFAGARRATRSAPRRPRAPVRSNASLSAAIQAWGEDLEAAGRSVHTVKAFTADLRLLARFMGAGHPINAIGSHDLRNFLDWMVNRRGVPCSPKTYSRRVTSMKVFFRWLNQAGALIEDPAAPVPQHSVLSPLPEVLTQDELLGVLKTVEQMRRQKPPDARPYVLVSLLLETGIKKGECLAIQRKHIDPRGADGPILWIRYGDVRKRYRERKLPLKPGWVTAYREYLEQYQPGEKVFPYSPRRLEYLLEEIGAAAGLKKKHLSFNMCRWTAALTDYKSGADKDRLRQKLGVSKIQWREVGLKLDRLAA
jgi:integrase/recombinase XerD